MFEVSCSEIRERIADHLDGELTVDEQIAVETHLAGCAACAGKARCLRTIRAALRAGAVTMRSHADTDLAGLATTVVSRLQAEQAASFGADLHRLFEDLHLVWVGAATLVVTVVRTALVVGALQFATPPLRADSLAGIMQALARPNGQRRFEYLQTQAAGSNANPVGVGDGIELPRMHPDASMAAMLVDEVPGQDRAALTLAAVVTQQGRISRSELLGLAVQTESPWLDVVTVTSSARFAPARQAGAPVAVNVVWVLERVTVRSEGMTASVGAGRSRFRG